MVRLVTNYVTLSNLIAYYICTLSKSEQKETYDKPPHIAQNEEPWRRLYDRATFASIRRSVMYQEVGYLYVFSTAQ